MYLPSQRLGVGRVGRTLRCQTRCLSSAANVSSTPRSVASSGVLANTNSSQSGLVFQGGSSSSSSSSPFSSGVESGTRAVVYANPICSQMDAVLLKARDVEEVLSLLVTHRGVFFVHNLVTALNQLASLSSVSELGLSIDETNPAFTDELAELKKRENKTLTLHGRSIKFSQKLHALQREIRYDLLLRDLRDFMPKMDFGAIISITDSLRQLDHRHLGIFNKALQVLGNYMENFVDASGTNLSGAGLNGTSGSLISGNVAHNSILLDQFLANVTVPDILTLLKNFQWAGYAGDNRFYSMCTSIFIRVLPNLSSPEQLVQIAEFYGSLDTYNQQLYERLSKRLEMLISPTPASGFHGSHVFFNLDQYSRLLDNCSKHAGQLIAGERVCNALMQNEALLVKSLAPEDISSYFRCVRSFRRLAIHYPEMNFKMLTHLAHECKLANHRRKNVLRRNALDINKVCSFLEVIGYFGVIRDVQQGDTAAQQGGSAALHNGKLRQDGKFTGIDSTSFQNKLFEPILKYCKLHVDHITEQGAIDFATFMFASRAYGWDKQRHHYVMTLIFRRIGMGTVWEKQKQRVFSLWLSHMLEFNEFEEDLPKRCVNEGHRAWALNATQNSELAEEAAHVLGQLIGEEPHLFEELYLKSKNLPSIETAQRQGRLAENGEKLGRKRRRQLRSIQLEPTEINFQIGVNHYEGDSPYVFDLYLPDLKIVLQFTNQVSRNTLPMYPSNSSTKELGEGDAGHPSAPENHEIRFPVGNMYLQSLHLRNLGYTVIPVFTRDWRALENQKEKLQFIRNHVKTWSYYMSHLEARR